MYKILSAIDGKWAFDDEITAMQISARQPLAETPIVEEKLAAGGKGMAKEPADIPIGEEKLIVEENPPAEEKPPIYRVVSSTDGKFIGKKIPMPMKDEDVVFGDYIFEANRMIQTDTGFILSNSNYIITLVEEPGNG